MGALDLGCDRDRGFDEGLRRGRPVAVAMPHHDEYPRRDRLDRKLELDPRVVLVDRQQRSKRHAQARGHHRLDGPVVVRPEDDLRPHAARAKEVLRQVLVPEVLVRDHWHPVEHRQADP
jgi:hypothetical protein